MDNAEARLECIRARGGFDRAEICVSGHVSSVGLDNWSNRERAYCSQCGAKTIQNCGSCGREIQGAKLGRAGTSHDQLMATYRPPAFCVHCGKPFPWVSAKVEAAKAIADELSELNEGDRSILKASIDEIAADTPMTEVAVVRLKKLIPKLGKDAADALRRLIVDVASETAKRFMTGG